MSMTPESEQLQRFLQVNLAHKFTHIKLQRFSDEAKILLKSILEKIETADKESNDAPLMTGNMFENFAPRGEHYSLCPEKARNHIENMKSVGQTCRFSIGTRKVNVHLVYEYDPHHPDSGRRPAFKNIFTNIYRQIYMLLHLLGSYARTECFQNLTIYLYLTSMKKTLADCDRDCTVGEDNANTAFTFSCKRVNELYIYRKEEWFKVLCHELFHSLGLDFSEHDDEENINKKLFEIFPVKLDTKLYEAYTEMWGELLNLVFLAYNTCRREPGERILRKIESHVYQERMFSVYQASKVLTHFGIAYEDLYDRREPAATLRRSYKETTPAFSYYIIKNVLMFHANDFVEWCAKVNRGSLEFDRENVGHAIDQFVSFIREHYNNPLLVESMDQARTWFLKQENNQRADKTPIVTMRMSLL